MLLHSGRGSARRSTHVLGFSVNEFRAAFRRVAQSLRHDVKVPIRVLTADERDVLVIPKQFENGLEVRLVCEDYGVYPSADGWHSGC